MQRVHPVFLTTLYFVKLFFNGGGELDIHNVRETLFHQLCNDFAKLGGLKRLTLARDVFAARDGCDGRSIRGRAADAVFLQRLDERGFCKACGWLCKVLRALEVADFQGHACFKLRQVFALFFFYVATLFVEHSVAVKRDVVAACFKNIIACGDDRLRGVQNTVCHLARDKALPNELIKLVLVFCKGRFHVLWCECNGGGANGLVTVLCVGTRLIMAWLRRQILLAPSAHR